MVKSETKNMCLCFIAEENIRTVYFFYKVYIVNISKNMILILIPQLSAYMGIPTVTGGVKMITSKIRSSQPNFVIMQEISNLFHAPLTRTC